MTISMHQASAPVFVRGLSSLKTVLTKGAAHAAAKKIDESVFINARLFPDMLALNRQVAAQIDGSEARAVTRPVRGEPKTFTGINYLLQYAMPNFYFHATTAYAILRSNGVEVGKADFIGALD